MEQSINELKAKIERHRVERARNYLVSSTEADVFEPDPEEDHLVSLIDAEKASCAMTIISSISSL